jgi:predicted exporter
MNEYAAIGLLCVAVTLCLVLTTRKDIVKNNSHANNVSGLVRSCKQWLDASKRDTKPLSSVLHAAHALAYLNAARSMMNDEDIKLATGTDVESLVTNVERQQRTSIERLNQPQTRPPPFRHKSDSRSLKDI